jgi:hypothetical protein
MKMVHSSRMCAVAICACLLPLNITARADQLQTDANWIIAGVAATGAAVGVGIYYALHHPASIKGCVASGSGGLELQNESDRQMYQLLGMTTDVKPGNRVRVTGKKKKASNGAAGNTSFLVEKLSKDYGACEVAAVK